MSNSPEINWSPRDLVTVIDYARRNPPHPTRIFNEYSQTYLTTQVAQAVNTWRHQHETPGKLTRPGAKGLHFTWEQTQEIFDILETWSAELSTRGTNLRFAQIDQQTFQKIKNFVSQDIDILNRARATLGQYLESIPRRS